MPTEIKAYKCQYCKGKFLRVSKKAVERHEERACLLNPDRKTCLTCEHLKEGDAGKYCDIEKTEGMGYYLKLKVKCPYYCKRKD